MRQDYAYIAKNTSLCLTTTEKGNAYCNTLSDEEIEQVPTPLNELLMMIQDYYLLIKDNSDIDGWITEIDRVYSDGFNTVNPGITRETILEALTKGFIGFRIAIWD